MVESLNQPKRHLALDMDWISVVAAVYFFLVFLGLSTGMVWTTVHGRFRVSSPSWWTPLLAAFLLYVGARGPDKAVRIGSLIFAIGRFSRLLLWLCRASYEARLINEIFVRWIDTALYFGVCGYVIHWVKSKVKYV